MNTKTAGAEALLEGFADEAAAILRAQLDALKDAPVVSDPAAVDRTAKAVTALCRANLSIRAVKAAEDKLEADKAQRLNNLEQMKMDEFTPDELELRAVELRARADRIMALIEAKCPKVGHDPAERDRAVAGSRPLRAV
jgi:hypothetical protein